MKEFRVAKNYKSVNLIANIIVSEDLDLMVKYEVTALGDSMVVVYGNNEDIDTLEAVYNMVK